MASVAIKTLGPLRVTVTLHIKDKITYANSWVTTSSKDIQRLLEERAIVKSEPDKRILSAEANRIAMTNNALDALTILANNNNPTVLEALKKLKNITSE